MCSIKVIVVIAIVVYALALECHCRDLGHTSLKQKQQNVSNNENKGRPLDDTKKFKNSNQQTEKRSKNVTSSQKLQHTKKKDIAKAKSGKKARSTENKDKKFALSYSPPSQRSSYQQPNEGYTQDAASQQQYFTSRFNGANQYNGQENQQLEQQSQLQQQQEQQPEQQQQQQQSYGMMTGGEYAMSRFQDPRNEYQGDNTQNVGMLQSLMEQRAAMYGQQEGNQEGDQRSYGQQQESPYQGQDNGPQEDNQQYQQGMVREAPSPQMGLQEGQSQEGQVGLSPEDETSQQGGAGLAAAYQQEGEQGEQQSNQLQDMQQQSLSPESVPQPGYTEGAFMMKDGTQEGQEGQEGQEQSYKGNEESSENYSQDSEGMQPTGPSMHPTEGGSIANIFSDPNSQANQDTQSIISEGQKITSSDAAQLAEAIENANKGIKGLKGFKSLSNVANNNGGALSFTAGESPGQPSDKKEENNFQESNPGLLFPETQNFNESPHSHSHLSNPIGFEAIYGKPQEQEYTHESNGGGGSQSNFQEEDSHAFDVHHGSSTMAHHAVKYCIGCPRNARCIDKVCIINGDEPLAKILGALSGPENETEGCKGCHEHARCVKKECICKPGYNGNGNDCKVDSCLPGCSKHGKCIRGFCVCDHHHYFNGIECAPYEISANQCPESCRATCFPHCPSQCCASTPSPTSQSSKKLANTASSFFLKPTLNQADDVFNKNTGQEKAAFQIKTSTQPQKDKPTSVSTINGKTAPHFTHSGDLLVSMDEPEKAASCAAECTTSKCGPACPDHCCKINSGKPDLKVNQIDFLKSIAEKFCPTSCQSSCSNVCPPVCCDKKTLISVLSSSPGSTMVDMSKAEDVFRNAIGWFSMMNIMHMMYNMYGKGVKPEALHFPVTKPTKLVTQKASVPADTCSPICKKKCLLSCPKNCCSANPIKRTYPHPSNTPLTKPVSQLESKGITRCPAVCSTRCVPLCPASCCRLASAKTSIVKPVTNRCKQGCSPKCYPQCTEYCCRSLVSNPPGQLNVPKSPVSLTSVVIQPYGCPTQCPKVCYPSCKRECCSSPEKSKSKTPEPHGRYYVNIACPMECRPFNCLSYCHHECCLRKNVISPYIKVKSSVALKPTKTTTMPTRKTIVKT